MGAGRPAEVLLLHQALLLLLSFPPLQATLPLALLLQARVLSRQRLVYHHREPPPLWRHLRTGKLFWTATARCITGTKRLARLRGKNRHNSLLYESCRQQPHSVEALNEADETN